MSGWMGGRPRVNVSRDEADVRQARMARSDMGPGNMDIDYSDLEVVGWGQCRGCGERFDITRGMAAEHMFEMNAAYPDEPVSFEQAKGLIEFCRACSGLDDMTDEELDDLDNQADYEEPEGVCVACGHLPVDGECLCDEMSKAGIYDERLRSEYEQADDPSGRVVA